MGIPFFPDSNRCSIPTGFFDRIDCSPEELSRFHRLFIAFARFYGSEVAYRDGPSITVFVKDYEQNRPVNLEFTFESEPDRLNLQDVYSFKTSTSLENFLIFSDNPVPWLVNALQSQNRV